MTDKFDFCRRENGTEQNWAGAVRGSEDHVRLSQGRSNAVAGTAPVRDSQHRVTPRRELPCGVLGLAVGSLLSACTGSAPLPSTVDLNSGPDAEAPSPRGQTVQVDDGSPPLASVGRTTVLCSNPSPELDTWFRLRAGARLLEGACNGKPMISSIDTDGRLAHLPTSYTGVAGYSERDGFGPGGHNALGIDGATVEGAVWLVMRWMADDATNASHTLILKRRGESWHVGHKDAPNAFERVLGIDSWPGATVAFVAEPGASQKLVVLEGAPTVPLPTLPRDDELSLPYAGILPTGHIYAVVQGRDKRKNPPVEGRVDLWVWEPGASEPRVHATEGMELAYPTSSLGLLARTRSEVYFLTEPHPVSAGDVRSKRVTVMRFDGERLVRSGTFDADNAESMTLASDGALWLHLSQYGEAETPTPWALWRRPPGTMDVWHPVASSKTEMGLELARAELLPTGNHDVSLLGYNREGSQGIYRVSLSWWPSSNTGPTTPPVSR